jgi:hypothetical protein
VILDNFSTSGLKKRMIGLDDDDDTYWECLSDWVGKDSKTFIMRVSNPYLGHDNKKITEKDRCEFLRTRYNTIVDLVQERFERTDIMEAIDIIMTLLLKQLVEIVPTIDVFFQAMNTIGFIDDILIYTVDAVAQYFDMTTLLPDLFRLYSIYIYEPTVQLTYHWLIEHPAVLKLVPIEQITIHWLKYAVQIGTLSSLLLLSKHVTVTNELLDYTIQIGELQSLQILLKCDINVQYEERLIDAACKYGQVEIFNYLVYTLHIEPDDLILYTACEANQPTIVSILLKHATWDDQDTQLRAVIRSNYVEVARVFLEYGINTEHDRCDEYSVEMLCLFIHTMSKHEIHNGMTHAVTKHDSKVIRYLLPYTTLKKRGRLFRIICEENLIKLATIFLQNGVSVDGTSIFLLITCQKGHVDLAKLLIQNGAVITAEMLAVARKLHRIDIIQLLT